MSSNYLVHHGRLGMHWGKRNGPPYPLDFKKLSAEEKQKAKEETIRKGDIKTANANKDHYTDNELNAVINRWDINQKISQLEKSQHMTTSKKINELCNKLDKATDNGKKIVKGYNFIAAISNNLLETELQKIDLEKFGKKKMA